MINNFKFQAIFLLVFIIIVIFSNIDYVNRDSYVYLKQASFFYDGNFTEAFQVYNWPFFSFLIAIVSKFLFIELKTSAHLISGIFTLITSLSLVKIAKLVTKSRYIEFYTFLIILSSTYIIGGYLPMIIRDHGYWAFFILSVFYFLKFIDSNNQSYYFVSILFIVIAFFFRLEAFVFLFYFLSFNFINKAKLSTIYKNYIYFFIFIFLCFLAYLSFFTVNDKFLGVIDKTLNFFGNFFKPIELNANDFFLNSLIEDNNLLIKFAIYILITLKKIILGLGFIAIFLFIYSGLNNKFSYLFSNFKYLNVLLAISTLSFFIGFFHLVSTNILATRYIVSGFLTLIPILGFLLKNFYSKKTNYYLSIVLKYFISILIFINIFTNLFINKEDFKKVSEFLENEIYPKSTNIFTNDVRIIVAGNLLKNNIPIIHLTDSSSLNSLIYYEYLILNDALFDFVIENSNFKEIKKIKFKNSNIFIFRRI